MTMGIQRLMSQIEHRRDAFHQAIHLAGELDAAMAVVTEDCELVNVPTGTGGRGSADLRRYLVEDLLPHLPADLTFRRVSRTVDQRRLVEESVVGFTHDRELPWLLPGVQPTHRYAEALAISVVTVRHTSRLGAVETRIASHRTLWDHAGLLVQLRLGPPSGAQR